MLTERKATMEDALYLSQNLREADARELEIVSGPDIKGSLEQFIRESRECYVAVTEDDLPKFVFGTTPSGISGLGYIWMVGTPEIEDHWIQIIRETRPWLKRISGDYKVLGNAVWKHNEVHIRWLRWAGFVFLREVSIYDEPFYEFATLT